MATTAAASDVEAHFNVYCDKALSEPVRIIKDGRETVYIVSASLFRDLNRGHREAIDASDLTDAEMGAIEAAEIPEEHRYTLES